MRIGTSRFQRQSLEKMHDIQFAIPRCLQSTKEQLKNKRMRNDFPLGGLDAPLNKVTIRGAVFDRMVKGVTIAVVKGGVSMLQRSELAEHT